MKRILILLLAYLPAGAALLHDAIGPFERGGASPFIPEDAKVYNEFGFEEGEEADYRTKDGRTAHVRVLQFYDDTGAFAAYCWLKPQGIEVLEQGERAVSKGDYTLIHFANYLLELKGAALDPEEIEISLTYLPRPKPSVDPPVLQYVPRDTLVPGSEHHVMGPVVLERLAPQLPPSTVGFHFGTEGHFGRYTSPDGELTMIIWDYPSAPIARGQAEAFHEHPNMVAKQDGPLVAVVLGPESPDQAQHLLSRVRYRAEVTVHHEDPKRYESIGNIFLDAVLLCAILATLMILGGVLVAGTRMLAGKFAPDSILAPPTGPNMQRLNIDQLGTTRRPGSGDQN